MKKEFEQHITDLGFSALWGGCGCEEKGPHNEVWGSPIFNGRINEEEMGAEGGSEMQQEKWGPRGQGSTETPEERELSVELGALETAN